MPAMTAAPQAAPPTAIASRGSSVPIAPYSALQANAGQGTRTPDTRIMIAPCECGGVRAVAGFPRYSARSGVGAGLGLRAVSVPPADTLLTPDVGAVGQR